MPVDKIITPRKGTAAQWTSANPVLVLGELGYETDTKRWKRGDGTTAWNGLAYHDTAAQIGDASVAGRAVLTAADAAAQRVALALGNVNNTSDAGKPVSTAQQTALDAKQAANANLSTISGLSPTNDDFLQRKSGGWANRTVAQVKADLGFAALDAAKINGVTVTGTPTAGQIPTATSGAAASWQNPGISGVTVTGTPSAGQVPTATSGSAATWQTPTGGGGGLTVVDNGNGTATLTGSSVTDNGNGTATLV